ncbi:MAG TPA: tetratricopeptide repeat protein [Micropepsaceae bacterium]|nr:tetratricopeptide repeat protein [Micropepsaceae bacterium]
MTDQTSRLQALTNSAQVHFQRGEFQAAERYLAEALRLAPESAELWNNRGTAQAAAKQLEAALASFTRSVELQPLHPRALANRANVLVQLQRPSDAIGAFEKLLRVQPDFPYAIGHLIFCKLQCGSWSNLDALCGRLYADLEAGKPAVTPSLATALLDKSPEQLRALQIVARGQFTPAAAMWRGERYRHQKIRIAYVSSDLHAHATAVLMAGVFEHHDQSRFETVAISLGPDDASPMRARLKNSFHRFINAGGNSDAQIASMMRQMEIDIAVDLKGYTSHARPAIFAFRPAPVQVNYLGFPATMAAEFIDYIIADRFTIPAPDEACFSEKVVRLPDSYQPNDRTREIAGNIPGRAELGLPETGFVYCCFNNSFKIQPRIFDVWMRLLREISGSVLWLLADNSPAVANLKREAASRGVDPERLVFAPRARLEDHLARHRLADLFLDTLPYNAHTTASDSLWAGLPVLTCIGGAFAGRVAAGILNAAGLPELITPALEEYESLALSLAREPARLASIRAKLAEHRDICPLFDVERFTRHLERAYTEMWKCAERGEPPIRFDL